MINLKQKRVRHPLHIAHCSHIIPVYHYSIQPHSSLARCPFFFLARPSAGFLLCFGGPILFLTPPACFRRPATFTSVRVFSCCCCPRPAASSSTVALVNDSVFLCFFFRFFWPFSDVTASPLPCHPSTPLGTSTSATAVFPPRALERDLPSSSCLTTSCPKSPRGKGTLQTPSPPPASCFLSFFFDFRATIESASTPLSYRPAEGLGFRPESLLSPASWAAPVTVSSPSYLSLLPPVHRRLFPHVEHQPAINDLRHRKSRGFRVPLAVTTTIAIVPRIVTPVYYNLSRRRFGSCSRGRRRTLGSISRVFPRPLHATAAPFGSGESSICTETRVYSTRYEDCSRRSRR